MQPYKVFKKVFIVLIISWFLGLSINSIAETSVFDGEWNSKEWRYGFKIEGLVGTVTDWDNNYNPDDPTSTGDVILTITEMTDKRFVAVHKFYDGSMIDVVAEIIDKDTIELRGRREVWRMTRSK